MPRKTPAPRGRPTALTPAVAAAILDHVADGVPYAHAARAAGIHDRTYHRWIERGATEQDRQDQGAKPDPNEEPFRHFRQEVLARRSAAVAAAVGSLQVAARGGFIVERSTRTMRDGSVEETEKVQPPDWRASSFLLRHVAPEDFGDRPSRVELTGSGGGPIEVHDRSLEQRLVEKLAEWREIQALEAADDDVVDGEVVD